MVTNKSRRPGSATAQELDFSRKKEQKPQWGLGGGGGDEGARGLQIPTLGK